MRSFYFQFQIEPTNYFVVAIVMFYILISLQKLELLPVIKFLKKHDFPSSRASELGVGLGIKKARIEEILQNNPLSSDKVLMGVIQHWLDDDVDQSWTKLADALQLCGYEQAARAITGEQPNSPSGNGMHSLIDIIPSLYNLH